MIELVIFNGSTMLLKTTPAKKTTRRSRAKPNRRCSKADNACREYIEEKS